ncbi:beta-xylosidase/alpha-L-arabinofuranosidase 2-like [Haliotis rufescens]|uniref:beta-xylosidase/alpha-L-arabinofuranosidase 2-like n=1 Tax=Haliotis rufescens TaxID=6454 RepID=UPI00201F41C2|nr:beta-xylosidase/alpha-L-arabinofuranosidase 2-like [Haliotis rufescens]
MASLVVVVVCVAAVHVAHGALPYQNTNLGWDARVDDLVSRMTLQEIQVQLASGQGESPAIPHLGIKNYAWWTNCGRGDVAKNATGFPQFIGIGASFDADLVYRMAVATSTEVRAYFNYYMARHAKMQIHMAASCFSPNVDTFRDPRWGRGQETFGEDPFHVGELGYMHVKGLHGNDTRYVRTSSGCKHYVISGGPEDWPISRHDFDPKVSTRDLRTYFLPPFRRCVEAGAYSLICSYNLVNGVPACANKEILTDILRGERNFKGYIAADAGEIMMMIYHRKLFKTKMEAAVACLKAGCNLEVEGGTGRAYLELADAVKQGKISETFVRDQMKPLIYTRMRLGEFDPPSMNPYNNLDVHKDVLNKDHIALALEAAMKSFVLLKNENNYLPLKAKLNTIAVVGPMSDNKNDIRGDYASYTDHNFVDSALDGLKNLANHVNYKSGCGDGVTCNQLKNNDVISAVSGVDAIFVCLGGGQTIEREGHDRHSVGLPGHQLDLLKTVVNHVQGGPGIVGKRAASTPIILLLFNGGPLQVTWAEANPHVTAILDCFIPHQKTGEAIQKVLTNDGPYSVPSAKMPYTVPASDSQIPPMTDYTMDRRTYWYFKGDPLYPFGYGLSYTTWRYSGLQYNHNINAGSDLKGQVVVSNTGNYNADEIIQVYVSWTDSSLNMPKYKLVAFGRVYVQQGQHTTFKFTISHKNLAVWDDKDGWKVVPGKMNLYVGGQQPHQKKAMSSNVLSGQFTITGTKVLGKF